MNISPMQEQNNKVNKPKWIPAEKYLGDEDLTSEYVAEKIMDALDTHYSADLRVQDEEDVHSGLVTWLEQYAAQQVQDDKEAMQSVVDALKKELVRVRGHRAELVSILKSVYTKLGVVNGCTVDNIFEEIESEKNNG